MSFRLISATFVVLLSLMWASRAWSAPPCAQTYKDLPAGTQSTTCYCAPDKLVGPLYGTRIYTTDSGICSAALHAGVIGQKGGVITVEMAPGCLAYQGSAANGRTSTAWSSYEASFVFPQLGPTRCPGVDEVGTGKPDPQLAAQFPPGTRVACLWRAGQAEYAGTVTEVRSGRLLVHYDDNDKELISPALCHKGKPTVGPGELVVTGPSDPKLAAQFKAFQKVKCFWRNGKVEYGGAVGSIQDGRLVVDYYDGGREAITPSLCRSDEPPPR